MISKMKLIKPIKTAECKTCKFTYPHRCKLIYVKVAYIGEYPYATFTLECLRVYLRSLSNKYLEYINRTHRFMLEDKVVNLDYILKK